ncbi:hypothetical protein ACI65C_004944 [Semiaphis heraclei]
MDRSPLLQNASAAQYAARQCRARRQAASSGRRLWALTDGGKHINRNAIALCPVFLRRSRSRAYGFPKLFHPKLRLQQRRRR